MASNKPVTESMQESSAFTGTDNEEITAIRSVIDAAEIKWGGSLSGGGYDGGQLGRHCGIRDYIITQSKCLCGVEILADDLIPNQTLRITISSLLSSRAGGLSSGRANLASSNSSNLDGKSVTASSLLKGDTKHHMDSAPSATTEGSCLITAGKNPVEKSTHSDLHSKTEETEKTSVKKTLATAGDMKTFPEPRCQKQPQPDGVAIVSGKLERKVVRTKSEKKQKKAGATGNGNTNCTEYGFNIPFEPPCYDSLFGLGGQPWGTDPYMYCMPNMPCFSYPLGPYNVNGISNLPTARSWIARLPSKPLQVCRVAGQLS
ncbi:unnamed protein product [Miscanthus lutarioriparius]|uniref:Uncharacterized protein n=1 Tax=Miscanthus lutarioriparius TaxID=422564 RepID=A0A811RH94_9POAL|nr:unnamed protein product [Miscanthus lutarioriparius]